MRVASKMQNMRARIGWLIERLKSNQTASLVAYGAAISTAIWLASIARNKVGDVHQITSLHELASKDDGRETSGVKIVLSKTALNESDPGYQSPEAKGFWSQTRKRKEPKSARQKEEKENVKPSVTEDQTSKRK